MCDRYHACFIPLVIKSAPASSRHPRAFARLDATVRHSFASPLPDGATLLNNAAEELAVESGSTSGRTSSHVLKRELGLWDLVPMQILLVVGITWGGPAAKQGGTHIWFWLAAILFMFIPLAAVTGWCARVWPL